MEEQNEMKKHMNFVIVFIVITGSFIMNEALAINVSLDATLQEYFSALKEGDVHTLSLLLSDDLSQRRDKLLKNPRYSGFLKKYYEGAQFKVIRFNPLAGNCMAVDIEVVSYGQTSFDTITFVEKGGKWKLLKEKKSYSEKEKKSYSEMDLMPQR